MDETQLVQVLMAGEAALGGDTKERVIRIGGAVGVAAFAEGLVGQTLQDRS